MKKITIAFFSLGILILACSLPSRPEETPIPIIYEETLTAIIPPTSTSTPFPTSVPTMVPVVPIVDADLAFFNGDWPMALLLYQNALMSAQNVETQAAALLGIGRTYYQLGDYPSALNSLRQLIDTYPESTQVGFGYFALAQTYEALLRYQDAVDAYNQYLESRGEVIGSYVHEWRGDALVAVGNYQGAIDVYQSSLAMDRLSDPLLVEMKIANAYAAIGDHETALVAYQDIYTRTTNDYTKAQADYQMGLSYSTLGQTEMAYAAYLDAVEKYPLSYHAYLSLILLVDAGQPVSEFERGFIDYFVEQFSLAIEAFDRYLSTNTEDAGTAYYYKGLAYLALDDPISAIDSWDVAIASYPVDENWVNAWDEKAYAQWAYLDQYSEAIQTLLDFVDENSWHPRSAEFLYNAARIAERDGQLEVAASLWERIPSEYSSSQLVPRSIFLAGISYFRLGDLSSALSTFDWYLGSSVRSEDKAAAYFWLAKTYLALEDEASANIFFQNAANEDPTGYYSERARDFIVGRKVFEPPVMFDLGFDLAAEKEIADAWVRYSFAVPESIDLTNPGSLYNDSRFMRGTELWNLGLYEMARAEFEALRVDIEHNPMDTYRLANYLAEIGLYRPAIFATRQVLDLNGMDDAETLSAPAYFNHIRFGRYYRDIILPAAEAYDFHPLFLFSVVRQESLFEGFVRSSAGARGLMQIMPATGASIAANANWPPGYTAEDLYRPKVSITLGANYLDAQRNYFNGDLYAALAAYNAGPGNAAIWLDLANGDPDLFVEIIRFDETRNYIKVIYEVFSIYRSLYDRSP